MKYTHTYRPFVFRFRRWSRKGYAVFSSLGWMVTIGRGSKSIADASLRKSGTMPLSPCMAFGGDALEEEEECPPGREESVLPSCPVAMCASPVPVCGFEAGACALRPQAVAGDSCDMQSPYPYPHTYSADDAKREGN